MHYAFHSKSLLSTTDDGSGIYQLLIICVQLKPHLKVRTTQGIKYPHSPFCIKANQNTLHRLCLFCLHVTKWILSWHLQPEQSYFYVFLVTAKRNTHTVRWISSHLIQQNEIIQLVVKIIIESQVGYMSVTVRKQVVLVLHTRFMGTQRNYIFSF